MAWGAPISVHASGGVPLGSYMNRGATPNNPAVMQVAWSTAPWDNPDEVRPCSAMTKKGMECPSPPVKWEHGAPFNNESLCNGHWNQQAATFSRAMAALAQV